MEREMYLLKTKNNIPAVRAKYIKRAELFNKLDKILDYRLALITAPVGFGKTTLLTSWLNRDKRMLSAAVWISLDEGDNDPKIFWIYFFTAFYKSFPKVKKVLNAIDAINENTDITFNNCISVFINEMLNQHRDMIVVLDDFHLINDEKILSSMKFLIKNIPPNIHLIISSRSTPNLGLTRLRAVDALLEIDKIELAFSDEECKNFFKQVMEIKLSDEKASYYKKETEGWAAGLQLAALAIRNSHNDMVEGKVGINKQFIFDYIAEEVFASLDKELKDFLLFTSILEQFCFQLCDFILNLSSSKKMIEVIDKNNLFLIGLDNDKTWFRYHNLFKDFLKKKFEMRDGETVHKIYCRAAEWYLNNNQIIKAVDYYIKGQNFDKAEELIEKIRGEILCSGEANILYKWNKKLPKERVLKNPRLLMNGAWAMCADGKTYETETIIKKVQKLLEDNYRSEEINLNIKVEIAALSVTNIADVNCADKILKDCEYVRRYLKPEGFLKQLIIFNIGRAELFKGNVLEANKNFEECLSICTETGQVYIEVVANKAINQCQKWKGRLQEVEQKCGMLIEAVANEQSISFSTQGLLYIDLSEVYYQRNELTEALNMAKKSLELGKAFESKWVTFESYVMLIKIYDAMNSKELCMKILKGTEEALKYEKLNDNKINYVCSKAKIIMEDGAIEEALQLISEMILELKDRGLDIYPQVYIMQIRILICKQEFLKARDVLDLVFKTIEKYEYEGLKVEALILSSLLFEATQNANAAIKELEQAVRLSVKEQIIRVFINERDKLKNMLVQLRKHLKDNGQMSLVQYVEKIIRSYDHKVKYEPLKKEILLKARELEVLNLLAEGASNAEISEKLFVSINTVKTHLLNIYTKLDVHSRTEALAKAKELEFL